MCDYFIGHHRLPTVAYDRKGEPKMMFIIVIVVMLMMNGFFDFLPKLLIVIMLPVALVWLVVWLVVALARWAWRNIK
jgi:hypothetical protein